MVHHTVECEGRGGGAEVKASPPGLTLARPWPDRRRCCRNWYFDEPSCGGEACVVMYHQPAALPGLGGAYLYRWNDDRCNMKHNFICKYEPGWWRRWRRWRLARQRLHLLFSFRQICSDKGGTVVVGGAQVRGHVFRKGSALRWSQVGNRTFFFVQRLQQVGAGSDTLQRTSPPR